MTLEDHPGLLRRFRDSGAATEVTLLTYLLTYLRKNSNNLDCLTRDDKLARVMADS